MERKAAEQREKAGVSADGKSGGRGRKKPRGNLPQGNGKTCDRVSSAVGMSGRTYQKAKEVVAAAKESPAKFGEVVERMDRDGGVYIHPATIKSFG